MNKFPHRLLVVDDSAETRFVVVDSMKNLGVAVVDQAVDGEEGLSRFRSGTYDLVLTDWNMPKTDGFQLLRSIRESHSRDQTRVLMLSGEVTRSRILQAVLAGADGFMPKPVPMDLLTQKVVALLTAHPVGGGR
jgi:two-component system, chemotaxis family, chemotaxis protein CheY